MRLGERLLQGGQLTASQLEQGLRTQRALSGRLGTNLIELGFVFADAVSKALAQQKGVPAARRKHFDAADPKVRKLVPKHLAERIGAIPLAMANRFGRELVVAFQDPDDIEGVEEVSRYAGVKVRPSVATEFYIIEYLDKLYGVAPRRLLRTNLAGRSQPTATFDGGGGEMPMPKGEAQFDLSLPASLAARQAPAHFESGAPSGRHAAAAMSGRHQTQPSGPGVGQPSGRHAATPPARGSSAQRRRLATAELDAGWDSIGQFSLDDGDGPGARGASSAGHTAPAPSGWHAATPAPQTTPAPSGWHAAAPAPDAPPALGAALEPFPSATPPEAFDPFPAPKPLDAVAAFPATKAPDTLFPTPRAPDADAAARQAEAPTAAPFQAPEGFQAVTPFATDAPDEAVDIDVDIDAESETTSAAELAASPVATAETAPDAAAEPATEARASATLGAIDTPPTNGSNATAETGPSEAELDASDFEKAAAEELRPSLPLANAPLALTAGEAFSAIERAVDRDQVADALIDYLRNAAAGLVLVCRQGLALGWRGHAPGADTAALEALSIPLSVPSMFEFAHRQGTPFHGAPPQVGGPIQERLWKVLHCEPPNEVLVCPVTIGGRVVNLLYAHGTSDVLASMVEELSSLAKVAADSYVELIKKRKQ